LDHGYRSVIQNLESSLNNFQTDYIDLYLIHFPRCWDALCGNRQPEGTWQDSWRAFEDSYKAGKVKAIGISNFELEELQELVDLAKVKPAVLQSWFDPFHQARNLVNFCKKNDIHFQAYSSLGTQWQARGWSRNPVFGDTTLQQIANTHNKTVAQVVIRWVLQQGISVIPRSNSRDHIFANLNVFDFSLSEEDMTKIDQLDGSLD